MTTILLTMAISMGSSLMLAHATQEKPKQASVYGFTVKDIDGKEVSLSRYKGKVVMLVNVASECGLTEKSYAGLEALHQKYKDQGFAIAAFPANNFGGQEPGSNSQIKEFCAQKSATFDLYSKISVAGPDQAPLFKFLTTHPNKGVAGKVEWNFQKYLIGRDGEVIAKYGPKTWPDDKQIAADIEKALAAQ